MTVPTLLRFSMPKAALHILLGAGFVALGLSFAWLFAFRNEALALEARPGGLLELLQSGGGVPGIVFAAAMVLIFGRALVLAALRLASDAPAAALANGMLRLHRSCGASVPLAAVRESAMIEEGTALVPLHALLIVVARDPDRPRRVRLRANTIEGGRAALEAFRERLEAACGRGEGAG